MKRLFSRLFNCAPSSYSRNGTPSPSRNLASSLEVLESRIAPAAVTVFSKGTLLVKGNLDGTLAIEQTQEAGTDVITTTITENGVPLSGTSSFDGVKNIVVKIDPKETEASQINMKLLRVPGSVEVLAPKAADTTVQIQGVAATGDLPQIGKSVLLKGGGGVESLVISSLDIGGGVVFPSGKGDAFFWIAGDVSIASNVGLVGVNSVTISPGAKIGGNLLITQKSALNDSFILGAGAKIDGNVVIFSGPGATTINAYAEVGGHFVANAGQGANAFNVSLIAKSLQYVGSSTSKDSVSLLRSEIEGSATFILGGGNNDVLFNIGPFDLLGNFNVGKGLSLGGGKDADLVRLDAAAAKVNVGGKAVFSLGSGDNVLFWNGTSTGSAISINGSGGVDTVRLFGLTAQNAALNVNLGGNNDWLALDNTFLKASLYGSSGNDEIAAGSTLPAKTTIKDFEIGVPA